MSERTPPAAPSSRRPPGCRGAGSWPGMAATCGAAVATSMFGDAFRQTAFGATGGNVLVVLRLRGGIDGLGMVVPHGDPAYYTARPDHRAAEGVAWSPRTRCSGCTRRWRRWSGCGPPASSPRCTPSALPVPNRSHFSAMEEIEDADPGSTRPPRLGQPDDRAGRRTEPVEAVQLGDSVAADRALRRRRRPWPPGRLADISLVGADANTWASRGGAPSSTGCGAAARRRRCSTPTASATRTVDLLAPTAAAAYTPTAGVTYPRDWPGADLADALKDTAQLIKADVGTDVVAIDFGSWDMHSDYGTTGWGGMQQHDRRVRRGARRVHARPRARPAAAGHRGDDQRVRPPRSRRTATAASTTAGAT